MPAEWPNGRARASRRRRARDVAARCALPDDARQGVVELMERKDGRIGGEMVHQAARADLGDSERDAFRTLAAATPEVRAQGIDDFLARATGRPAGAASTPER